MSGKAFVGNAADREQVREGRRKENDARNEELEDVRAVLGTIQGRRFVWRFLHAAGVFRSSFTGDNKTFFNEGRRNMGLMVMADVMEADPSAYVRMAQEAEAKKEPEPVKGDGNLNQEEKSDE